MQTSPFFAAFGLCLAISGLPFVGIGKASGQGFAYSGPNATICDDFAERDVIVFCRLVERSPDAKIPGKCTFEEYECLKGAELLAAERGAKRPYRIKMLYFGDKPLGTEFYCCGEIETPEEQDPTKRWFWVAPTVVDRREQDYIRRVPQLPASRAERLPKLYEYLEDPSPLLMFDVQDEIDRATYAELRATRAAMPKAKLLRWIADPNITTVRRRQYLRMLGICGSQADLPLVQAMIARNDRQTRLSLDAQLECYLELTGESGLPLIEEEFFKNQSVEYSDAYAALMAVRFAAGDAKIVSPRRAILAYRLLLDRSPLADFVVPDLARANDWASATRIMQLCRAATQDDDTKYVLPVAATYFRQCPTTEAKRYLVELTKLDPEAVARSYQYWPGPDVAPQVVAAHSRCGAGARCRRACRPLFRIASSWRCRVGRPAVCRR